MFDIYLLEAVINGLLLGGVLIAGIADDESDALLRKRACARGAPQGKCDKQMPARAHAVRLRAFAWRMIFSENRYPPRIKCGAGFFGIMR